MEHAQIPSIVGGIPMPAILIGSTERIEVMNAQAVQLLGADLAERHYVTALRQPAVLDCVEATLRSRSAHEARYLTTISGQDATYHMRCHPLVGAEGAPGGALLTFEDVSALEEAGQMRRDFVANVSHELRTPLTALAGFIETLQGSARDDAQARDRFLSIMAAEAARMNRLVRDLLSLSRVESEVRMRPEGTVDLANIVQSAVHTMTPVARRGGVELRLSNYDMQLPVIGDPEQLRQVFTNLIENAIKYGASGKFVDVAVTLSNHEVALRGPAVQVQVIDHGEGIDPIHLPRLTERFYRVDNHRSREMGGTGLGLAIVKHIVNRHRGRMRIESELGEGCQFTVMLPFVA